MFKRDQPRKEDCDPFEDAYMKELARMEQIKCGVYSLYDVLLPDCTNISTNVELEQEILAKQITTVVLFHIACCFIEKLNCGLNCRILFTVASMYIVYRQRYRWRLSYLSNMDLKNRV